MVDIRVNVGEHILTLTTKVEGYLVANQEPDVKVRDDAPPIIRQEEGLFGRDLGGLEQRTSEPDDIEERTCTYASICRREGEVVERDDETLLTRDASPDPAPSA